MLDKKTLFSLKVKKADKEILEKILEIYIKQRTEKEKNIF